MSTVTGMAATRPISLYTSCITRLLPMMASRAAVALPMATGLARRRVLSRARLSLLLRRLADEHRQPRPELLRDERRAGVHDHVEHAGLARESGRRDPMRSSWNTGGDDRAEVLSMAPRAGDADAIVICPDRPEPVTRTDDEGVDVLGVQAAQPPFCEGRRRQLLGRVGIDRAAGLPAPQAFAGQGRRVVFTGTGARGRSAGRRQDCCEPRRVGSSWTTPGH